VRAGLEERGGVIVYVYAWGNNERRAQLRGRECVIEARGAMRTILVRFLDTDERVTTSARAVRRKLSEPVPSRQGRSL
jgi:hypothetical protein